MQATKIPERIIHNDNWRIFMPDLVWAEGERLSVLLVSNFANLSCICSGVESVLIFLVGSMCPRMYFAAISTTLDRKYSLVTEVQKGKVQRSTVMSFTCAIWGESLNFVRPTWDMLWL